MIPNWKKSANGLGAIEAYNVSEPVKQMVRKLSQKIKVRSLKNAMPLFELTYKKVKKYWNEIIII